MEENGEDGDRDRIVILPDVSHGELKTFVESLGYSTAKEACDRGGR